MDARKEMAQLMRTSMEQPSQDTLFGEPAPEPQPPTNRERAARIAVPRVGRGRALTS